MERWRPSMDNVGPSRKIEIIGDETITVKPDGLGQVTITCETGSKVEINFNTKTFHFHHAQFDTDQVNEIFHRG